MRISAIYFFACFISGVLPAAGEQVQKEGAALIEKENLVEVELRGTPWKSANLGAQLNVADRLRTGELSRAAIRFTDLSVLRVDELTNLQIVPPANPSAQRELEVERGGAYFFSRQKGNELQIRTPSANGALRGTEIAVRVGAGGQTTMTVYEGEVEMANPQGTLLLKSGEQGEAEIGKPPRKTAVIDAKNIIQWCLYYPAVIDPGSFRLEAGEAAAFAESLASYRQGDLLGALAKQLPLAGNASTNARLYHAATVLSVGQVERAQAALAGVPTTEPSRLSIEQMIAAVKLKDWKRSAKPRTSSEWMAESYYKQSKGELSAALQAARKATQLSPEFGFAWVRVAELLFSTGNTKESVRALDRGLKLAPQNAQGHALRGFILSAENRIDAARRSFEEAIARDGALGNAWLGRGLTSIRQGRTEEGRRDLQTAATLEPNRSILRSYLGKGFSEVGNKAKAKNELDLAKELDLDDPTPWLYSAIERSQSNQYNQAVEELEKSVKLNENRRIYRSQFLLDQDKAVRSTNLALMYLNNGMKEQGVREAVRALNDDYASAGAHLFLSNSFNALRDPSRFLLRYETAAQSELLMSSLLSPVGGGPLSQFVSEQEYSKLFEKDGLGLSAFSEYRSDGQLRAVASQYGTSGNIAYALDGEYRYSSGVRPNNSFSNFESTGTFKLQLGLSDSIFLQVGALKLRTGDVSQYEYPKSASLNYRLDEDQNPGALLLGWHREWSPGNHTLLLLGRFATSQTVTSPYNALPVTRDVAGRVTSGIDSVVQDTTDPFHVLYKPHFEVLRPLVGGTILGVGGTEAFDLHYRNETEIYSAELQQIAKLETHSLVVGGRYQAGAFRTNTRMNYATIDPSTNQVDYVVKQYFQDPAAQQSEDIGFERVSLYAYDTWHAAPWLSLTGGVTYDAMRYPDNFRAPPINGREATLDRVSPKAGAILQPWSGATLRGAYAEAISGTSLEESYRLEPSQVSGLLQAYRAISPESLLGSVEGSRYTFSGLGFEQKLPTRTYLGIDYQSLSQNVDRTQGVFDCWASFEGEVFGFMPSSLAEKDRYREKAITATLNQLVGRNWALGASYRRTQSSLRIQYPEIDASIANSQSTSSTDFMARLGDNLTESVLHTIRLQAHYNHPSGFFAQGEANWYRQTSEAWGKDGSGSYYDDNLDLQKVVIPRHDILPSYDFWQFNALAGYRFYRNRCEVSSGVLNIAGKDYRLNTLNPNEELPRERTFVVRCRVSF